MAESVRDLDVVRQAEDTARAVAENAGITIVELDDMERLDEAARLFQVVWGPDEPIVSSSILRALSHTGNYVAAAYLGDRMLGAIVGFLARRSADVELHSHVLGVLEASRGRNVGFALKQHQRAWSLARGITSVTWTFDPLVRRNAYFNLTKLGARVTEYYENFYGEMADDINGTDDSDRVLVTWQLDSSDTIAASLGRAPHPDHVRFGGEDQAIVLSPDGDGAPEARRSSARMLLAWIPEDIVEIRDSRPDHARAWRLALREAVGGAVGDGYAATGVTRGGWLLLQKAT